MKMSRRHLSPAGAGEAAVPAGVARGGGPTVTSATGELIAGFGRELRATITEGLAAVGQRLHAAAWEDVSR